jgi:hypothetical protein
MIEDLSLLRQDFLRRFAHTYLNFFCVALTVLFAPSAVNWMLDLPAETMLPTPIEQLRLYLSLLTNPSSTVYFEHFLESGLLGFLYYFGEASICYGWSFGILLLSVLYFIEGILLLISSLIFHLDL